MQLSDTVLRANFIANRRSANGNYNKLDLGKL